MNPHANRLVLITVEDWEQRVESMDKHGEYEEVTIRKLKKCIDKCDDEDDYADRRGYGFEEQMEAYQNKEAGAEKPKNMCLRCFKELPKKMWKLPKIKTPTTTTTTKIATTKSAPTIVTTTFEPKTTTIAANTNAPTTITATTASGAVTATGDSRISAEVVQKV